MQVRRDIDQPYVYVREGIQKDLRITSMISYHEVKMIYWVDEPYWDPPCGKQAGWELHLRNVEEMGSPIANVVH